MDRVDFSRGEGDWVEVDSQGSLFKNAATEANRIMDRESTP